MSSSTNGVPQSSDVARCTVEGSAPPGADTSGAVLAAFHSPQPMGVAWATDFGSHDVTATSDTWLTDDDVLDATRRDTKPETFTDLMGKKQTVTPVEVARSLSPDAAKRIASLLAAPPDTAPLVVVLGRVSAGCSVIVPRSGPSTLILRWATITRYVNGAPPEQRDGHEDAERVLARYSGSKRR